MKNNLGLKRGFYVNFQTNGCIDSLYRNTDSTLYKLEKDGSESIPKKKWSHLKNFDTNKLIKEEKIYFFLKNKFMENKCILFLGEPVTNETFDNPFFLEKLREEAKKEVVLFNTLKKIPSCTKAVKDIKKERTPFLTDLIDFGVLPQRKSIYDCLDFGPLKNEKDTHYSDAIRRRIPTSKLKNKTKFVLYRGEVEIITGYSLGNVKITSEKLMYSIDNEKHIVVFGKNQEVIAFYNRNVVSELSFSIYSLEE